MHIPPTYVFWNSNFRKQKTPRVQLEQLEQVAQTEMNANFINQRAFPNNSLTFSAKFNFNQDLRAHNAALIGSRSNACRRIATSSPPAFTWSTLLVRRVQCTLCISYIYENIFSHIVRLSGPKVFHTVCQFMRQCRLEF